MVVLADLHRHHRCLHQNLDIGEDLGYLHLAMAIPVAVGIQAILAVGVDSAIPAILAADGMDSASHSILVVAGYGVAAADGMDSANHSILVAAVDATRSPQFVVD